MIKKRLYLCPRVTVTDFMEHEGLICASPIFNVQVKELDHINDFEGEDAPEQFYFGS